MKKVLFILEIIIISVALLQFSLNYKGNDGVFKPLTIPNFGQVKNSISVTSADSNNAAADLTGSQAPKCDQIDPVGFPL